MGRKKRQGFSTVVNLMSQETREQLEDSLGRVLLTEILPDVSQPRILLPMELAQALQTGELTCLQAYEKWAQMGENRVISELHKLAESIARHGLINAITVREPVEDEKLPKSVKYIIVTGERRYWAHCLLSVQRRQIQEGEKLVEPTEIKVSLVAKGVSIRAHQLIENVIREDINAYEKAIGMWALRAELSGVNHGSPLDPSQLNSRELVPWSQVEETLSISKRYRIYVTKVLKLCPEALELIQTHNLSERLIRPIVQKLAEKPELQVKALKQLITTPKEKQSTPASSAKEIVQDMLHNESSHRSITSPLTGKFQRQIRGILRLFNDMKPDTRKSLRGELTPENVAELQTLRNEIDAILS